jgi:hypothetical protein
MIIPKEKNRAYNALLNSARKTMCPYMPPEKFRREVKNMDPEYPMVNNTPKSMTEITEPELYRHMSFLKTMLIKRGVVLEYFSKDDISRADDANPKARVIGDFEEEGDGILVDVVCSSCGAATTRKLTPERYAEILLITDGEKEESKNTMDSFQCAWCVEKKTKEKQW